MNSLQTTDSTKSRPPGWLAGDYLATYAGHVCFLFGGGPLSPQRLVLVSRSLPQNLRLCFLAPFHNRRGWSSNLLSPPTCWSSRLSLNILPSWGANILVGGGLIAIIRRSGGVCSFERYSMFRKTEKWTRALRLRSLLFHYQILRRLP